MFTEYLLAKVLRTFHFNWIRKEQKNPVFVQINVSFSLVFSYWILPSHQSLPLPQADLITPHLSLAIALFFSLLLPSSFLCPFLCFYSECSRGISSHQSASLSLGGRTHGLPPYSSAQFRYERALHGRAKEKSLGKHWLSKVWISSFWLCVVLVNWHEPHHLGNYRGKQMISSTHLQQADSALSKVYPVSTVMGGDWQVSSGGSLRRLG